MFNEFMTVIGQLSLVTIIALAGVTLFRLKVDIKWLLIALSLYFVNDFMLTRAFGEFPWLLNTQWNWEGKFYALVTTLLIATLPQFGFRCIGLTWYQGKNPLPAYALTLFLAIFFVVLAFFNGNEKSSIETIAFQWSMPGLEEEAFYRGTLLLAMNEAFKRKVHILGAPIGYGGVLATLLFGFGHALSYDNNSFEFETLTFLVTGIPAFLLLWIRERTGSLLLPILIHNIANGAGTIF